MDVDEARKICETYARAVAAGDVETIVGLFAPDATLNDPVDSASTNGIEAIRAFYKRVRGAVRTMEIEGPIRLAKDGSTAAVCYRVIVGRAPSQLMLLESIDVFDFNAAGRIVALRGYYGPSNRNPIG